MYRIGKEELEAVKRVFWGLGALPWAPKGASALDTVAPQTIRSLYFSFQALFSA